MKMKELVPGEAYFWAIHQEAELDLLCFEGGKRFGYEFKGSDSPRATRSMFRAIETLCLESLTVVVPAGEPFRIDGKIEVRPLSAFA